MLKELPKVRSNIRADNFVFDGEGNCVVISDVLIQGKDIKKKLKLSHDAWQIALLFDGESNVELIRDKLNSQYWRDVSSETVQSVISELDRHYLLDNERYRQKLNEIKGRLAATECRTSTPSPHEVEMAADKVLESLKQSFLSPLGPGCLPSDSGPGQAALKGVIVPHANYEISGPCAAHAYHEIARCGDFDLFVIFGYNHIYGENRIETLVKDIITPLGKLVIDSDFAHALLNRTVGLLEEGGVANYYEHSIDMQLPMLQFVMQSRSKNARVLPIILSNVPKIRNIGKALQFKRTMENVGDALRSTAAESGKKVCFIASGDFTHFGLYYGDNKADSSTVGKLHDFDSQSIQMLQEGRKNDFYLHTIGSKYCCVTPVYLLLSSLNRIGPAKLLKYYTTWDILGESKDINSFVAMAFYE